MNILFYICVFVAAAGLMAFGSWLADSAEKRQHPTLVSLAVPGLFVFAGYGFWTGFDQLGRLGGGQWFIAWTSLAVISLVFSGGISLFLLSRQRHKQVLHV